MKMTTVVIIPSLKWSLCVCFILLFLSTHCYWFINAGDDVIHGNVKHHVQVTSLLPAAPDQHTCNPSLKGDRRGTSLKVRHRYGPCSPLGSNKSIRPTHAEILDHDEARVDSIRNRVRANLNLVHVDRIRNEKNVGIPAKSGHSLGSGNFIVTIGLGTPKKDLSLVFDTGSDFTWTQCEPCVKSCYKQQETVFDPSVSSTYSNITCTSPLCLEVKLATGQTPGCSSSTCVYGIQYGDSSFSVGYFAKETLYLGPYDEIPNFLFGCGENNEGLFGSSAGLIGLGRNKLSLVSQTSSKYGKYFSYCLPSRSTSIGHLTFGQGGTYSKTPMQYIPLVSNSANPSLYFIDLQGITIGGQKLPISPSVFLAAGGTIIDSGTVISRLPPDAYSALKTTFSKFMSKYPKAPALSILDTCYNFSSYNTVTVPKISLLFSGGTHMDIGVTGILYVSDISQVCLAFAGNTDADDVGILGNVQQLTFDIAYDVADSKLGFAPGGCV